MTLQDIPANVLSTRKAEGAAYSAMRNAKSRKELRALTQKWETLRDGANGALFAFTGHDQKKYNETMDILLGWKDQ